MYFSMLLCIQLHFSFHLKVILCPPFHFEFILIYSLKFHFYCELKLPQVDNMLLCFFQIFINIFSLLIKFPTRFL